MASHEIVLYDIPSRPPCRAWSLNTWRVRLILNYKNIPYRTEWLEYPDIKPKLSPHFPGQQIETYTVPTIALPDGREHIMNSRQIAKVLEAKYPSPPLLLDSPIAKRVTGLLIKIWDAIEVIILTHVHKRLLDEVNFPFWRETREPWLNPDHATKDAAGDQWKTLDTAEAELYANGGALLDECWANAGPAVDEIAQILRESPEGPFFCGEKVSFSDFQWIGFLLFIRRIGQDQWDKMKASAKDFEPHEELLRAASDWIKRDDH
ncbi:putative glutathione S-transferase [Microdochium trichocladiopsis]|uniref:Glutathione S-transferase n=1 Tax=Microdochium trichocladiopsis TaxID=1682393 RepID=A0A9P8Y232_9PEZI|nr:putative glutathione S-transferase [Microdochium trichocladiopsis]KAH7029024.1 putative glutathione S-transferase [Microdochium trichocladiopsis]